MKSREESYGEKKISKIDVKETIKKQFEELIDFLNRELAKIKEINAVVLFGSFARGDYSVRHSDTDIMVFIDKTKKDRGLEEKIREKIINLSLGRELSVHTLFQYRNLDEEDKSLMLTISKEGKVLFAKKTLVISNSVLGLKSYFLVRFDTSKIKPVIKNKLQRFLYGYKRKGKRYKGIVNEETVFSAGKGAVIVPLGMLEKVLLFAKNLGIKVVQKGEFYK